MASLRPILALALTTLALAAPAAALGPPDGQLVLDQTLVMGGACSGVYDRHCKYREPVYGNEVHCDLYFTVGAAGKRTDYCDGSTWTYGT